VPVFAVHPRLLEDCHPLGKLTLCHLLLHRNATLPWFILVPEIEPQIAELHQLDAPRRRQVSEEVDRVSRFARERMAAQKINVATLGNIVRQLHVHVVGRCQDDPCWPGVVWGRLPPGPGWARERIEMLVGELVPLGLTRQAGQ
jgi:diadenosine tetraphosphate (Ap4A) HIT family hydrolase